MSATTFPANPAPTIGTLKLKSDYGEVQPESITRLKQTPKGASIEEMRAKYEQDGYVLIKGLLPREDVLKFREKYFSTIRETTGIVEKGKEVDGILAPGKDSHDFALLGGKIWNDGGGSKEYLNLINDLHQMPEFLALNEHPDLVDFVKRFAGWENPVLYKRSMIRMSAPNADMAPVHYDKMFLRGGDPSFLTFWVPLGDISINGGGLMYLEDSIPIGQQFENRWQEAANVLTPDEKLSAFNSAMTGGAKCAEDAAAFGEAQKRKWMVSDFEAGDVVVHNSFLIHASCLNEDPTGRIRLATDIRYADSNKKVDERWLNSFKIGDGL